MRKDKVQTEPGVLKQFAHLLDAEILNGRLEIPEKFGKGYCKGFVFNEHIRMLILNFELRETLILKNPDLNAQGKMILFKFQNVFSTKESASTNDKLEVRPSVLITTSTMNTDVEIQIDISTGALNIEVDADYLSGLFYSYEKSPVLESLLRNTQPLMFEQVIYPTLQKIVDEILSESVVETFKPFFLRVKAEELICKLLIELEKRDEKKLYDLNISDLQAIYKVKEQILERLEIPPVIKDLAADAQMSPTKLKRLFKQIFGNSIFSYYQDFRMKAAARLLKEEKRSVSAVGYQLGFTNLSHFARVFQMHIGMNPKQYSQI